MLTAHGIHPAKQQTDGHEVPIGELFRDIHNVRVRGLKKRCEISHRDRRNEVVTGDTSHLARVLITYIDCRQSGPCALDADGSMVEVYPSSENHDFARHFLPQLTRSKFGIKELLNQTGFGSPLKNIRRVAKRAQHGMCDGLRYRQALDTLSTPLRGYRSTRYSPHFLGVVLEECAIEAFSKAIHEELLERGFRRRRTQLGSPVAQTQSKGLHGAHIF